MKIQRITAAEARPLRHRVLRPHQPLDACVYPDDDHPDSGHFGVLLDDELVGAASIYQQSDAGDDPAAWRIRGMVNLEEVRGRGYGGALLEACLRHAADHGGRRVWCNGRSTVAGFYERFGFSVKGEEFDIPGLGPHLVMEKML
ncbi:MAG: GNAT family N-acetyltransferase [Thermoanaerobaculia bacterium]